MMASKFYVSPKLFAQILPLQLPALKSCGRRLTSLMGNLLSEARGDFSAVGDSSPSPIGALLTSADAVRHCNGRIWAKSLRLMQNFDDFVMIQETEIPKSI